jgi:hypothetical protein
MSRISPAALTKEQLVDRWGGLRSKLKKLEAEIEPLKEEFERRGLSVVAGEAWGVARSESTFASLDVKAIRALRHYGDMIRIPRIDPSALRAAIGR